ncbi:HAD hydrolase family protein [Flavobacteriaceae bacterium]|nr:HAD hydrolase family protein [Flavobacteriaceae bacterium]
MSMVVGHHGEIIKLISKFKIMTIKNSLKLFLSDVDGVLTDGSMYYSEMGDEMKRFNTYDGMAFELIRNQGIKTGIITSEKTQLVKRRADKLNVDYLFQGKKNQDKLKVVLNICKTEGFNINEVAYIGDDINCKELLEAVGFKACPLNARPEIKLISGINVLKTNGGSGAVREWAELLLKN